jgi:signal transduction histidine kinase
VKYGQQAEVTVTPVIPDNKDGPRSIVVTVDDHGPGIPPGERARVFEPFRRLDESRNRDIGGAGLGLAIARQVTEGHGGTIELGDAPPAADGARRGARFTVTLPMAG